MSASRRALLFASALAACSDATGGDDSLIPDTGAAYTIHGTALSGMGVAPGSVELRAREDSASIAPEPIGGGVLDMFLAGFESEDLPRGVDPLRLRVVSGRSGRAHALFSLRQPHVLARPVTAGASFSLVPTMGPGIPASVATERARRLDVMTRDLAIEEPCRELDPPIELVVPTTPGEAINALRAVSSGITYAALTTTSTVLLAAIDVETRRVELIGVDLGIEVERRDRARVTALGNSEVRDRSGRLRPRDLGVTFDAKLEGLAQVLTWDETRNAYAVVSPDAVGTPAVFTGVQRLELDGSPSLCAFGAELGPNRVASIYCRVETSTVWTAPALFRESFSISAVFARPGGRAFAVDQLGTVYARRGGRWEDLTRAAINDGCAPPCALFPAFTPSRGLDRTLGAIGGTSAQALVLEEGAAGEVTLRSIEPLPAALFAEERSDGARALKLSAAVLTPDGALWLASTRNLLLRVAPDRTSVERICLPAAARDIEVSAIEALPSGELILGLYPAILGFGRWRP